MAACTSCTLYYDDSATNTAASSLNRSDRERIFVFKDRTFIVENIPRTVEEVITMVDSFKWKTALQLKFWSLKNLDTWELVQLPSFRKFISPKKVFDFKKDVWGKVVRHKARLVAKSFPQILSADITKLCSPVSKYTAVQFIFAASVYSGWKKQRCILKTRLLT